MSFPSAFRFWAIVPAAGRGARMVAEGAPKQYLRIAQKTVLEWSVGALLNRQDCAGVVVVLAEGDEHWAQLELRHDSRVIAARGGSQRTDSVAAGLEALASRCHENDWVLVHDAARPCLSAHDLQQLIETLRDDEVGGLLGTPIVDTLKRSDGEGLVAQTVSREGLWRALTPQMFRYGLLRRALIEARSRGAAVTDEAQAVEFLGLKPRLVPGNADNIKVTLVDDLRRAERILLDAAVTGTQTP